jgi:hypothetical protein
VKNLILLLDMYSWQVVFSLRSRWVEIITKWTTSPDLMAADSTAHACRVFKVPLPEVSNMKSPFSIELI